MQGCVDPKPKKKTQRRGGEFQEIPLQILENRVERRTPKNSQPSAPQPQGHSRQRTRLERKTRHTRAPKNFTNWCSPGKTSFSKRPQLCSPKPFFTFPTQFGQNFEFPKNCETRKNYSQKNVQNQGDATCPKQEQELQKRQIVPKPFVLKRFASYYLLECAVKTQDAKDKKTKNLPNPKKNEK